MDALDEKEQKALARLHYWHLSRLIDLGFARHQAEILELANVDWRDADNLLKRGCPHETALLILT